MDSVYPILKPPLPVTNLTNKHSMRRLLTVVPVVSIIAATVCTYAEEAVIRIDAGHVLGEISPYLTGACIEGANHEIYGGIYSQMVFGESFQEPSTISPLHGFRAYGGNWELHDDQLWADTAPGSTLVSETPAFAEGAAGVEMFFIHRQPGNAGLIVKLARPGLGGAARRAEHGGPARSSPPEQAPVAASVG